MDLSPLWDGLALLFHAQPLTFLAVGLVGGFLVGVLPGFEATNAAALALPFTLVVPTESALILMGAVYAGASFAGAVPAILVNVPGTAGAAATALDGYPMAQQGRAIEAIAIARVASAVGGLISATFVLLLVAPMSQLALDFRSPETFLVAVLGLLVIGGVLGRNLWKGLLAALLGLLVASMSASPATGVPRWTFGFSELYEDVPFVPVIVGIFALSEMFLLARRSRERGAAAPKVAKEPRTTREALLAISKRSVQGMGVSFRYPVTLVRSSLVGLGIGILPGMGVGVANFVSYGIAQRRSPRGANFGHGEPEGVVAAEACDNAVVAGSLVPTFTLGIPGSATAAVMLAALYTHGIQPGPRLMTTNGPEVYSVLWSVLIASVLIVPLGIALATPLTYITRVAPSVLVPVIIVLSLVGSFALRGLMFDVALTLVFGIVGVVMRTNGFPVVPFVIALVLSPILESNLLRSVTLSQGSAGIFFESGWSRVLWGIFLALVVSKLVSAVRRRRADPEDPTPGGPAAEGDATERASEEVT